MKVIGLTGNKQNGKSSAAQYLCDNYNNIERYSFSTPLKLVCKMLFGGTQEHWLGSLKDSRLVNWGLTPRQIMKTVGTELFRTQFSEDFWVKVAREHLDRVQGFHDSDVDDVIVIIDDVRFDNEAKMITDMGGKVYRIVNLGAAPCTDTHASEAGISEDLISAVVEAKDIAELYLGADFIAKDNALCSITTH